MKRFRVFSVFLVLAAFAMPAGPAFAEFTPVGTLLFQDTYICTPANVFDINSGINSPTRVYGPLAGQVSYDQANSKALTAVDGTYLQLTGQDITLGTTGRVGLNKDFNGALALGGFTVCARINPGLGYAGIGVGHNGSNYANIDDLLNGGTATNNKPGGVPGLYGSVFSSSIFGLSTGVFCSDGSGSPWYSNFTSGGFADFVDLAIVFTDIDNNPFNGSGTITATVYVNGTQVDTASGPDFAHNYISLQASAAGGVNLYQDLRIYGNAAAVPEPGTLALLAAAAGFAFVWLRRRR